MTLEIHAGAGLEHANKIMDKSLKLTTYGTQDEEKQNKICWTPLCASKHK
jgi:hypothetical protein